MSTLRRAETKLKQYAGDLLKKQNVNGLAVGRKKVGGETLGFSFGYSVVVFVTEKKSREQLKERDLVPTHLDNVLTDVVELGEVSALHTRKHRPLVSGISVGHKDITAGTLGGIVRLHGSKNLLYLLSNNHVLANSNDARLGDEIMQPGPHDGGTEVAAYLFDYVPVKFAGDGGLSCPIANRAAKVLNLVSWLFGRNSRVVVEQELPQNLVDAAIAEPIVGAVREVLGLETTPVGIGEAALGDKVVKSGRTTGVTEGVVEYVNAQVNVNFGPKGTALFVDQIITSHMSEPGDSGSVITKRGEEGYEAVGLLFAGSNTHTIANRMSNVADLLSVEF